MGLRSSIQLSASPGYMGVPDEEDLALIQRWSSKTLDPQELFVFGAMACNAEMRKDQPWRVGLSSLQNFERDMNASVPYHVQHDRTGRVGGYTFAAYLDAQSSELRSAIYLHRGVVIDPEGGVSTDNEIEAIQNGLRRSVSVGPGGAEMKFICDLCGNNMFSFECPHLLGFDYEGKTATAAMEDARVFEISGVDIGAIPDSFILKAQSLTRSNALSTTDLNSWCDKYKLTNPARSVSMPASTTQENPMRQSLAALLARLGFAGAAASVLGAKDDEHDSIAPALGSSLEAEVQNRVAANPLIVALNAAGITTVEQFNATSARAKLGEKYENDLRTDAKAQANRLYGAENGPKISASVDHMPAEHVASVRDGWQQEADQKFGIGKDGQPATRTSASTPLPPLPSAGSAEGGGDPDRISKLKGMTNLGREAQKMASNGRN